MNWQLLRTLQRVQRPGVNSNWQFAAVSKKRLDCRAELFYDGYIKKQGEFVC